MVSNCFNLAPHPAFGPTYIHLYHPVNSRIYLGKILIEVTLEEFLEDVNTRLQTVLSIPHLIEADFWKPNTFRLSMRLFGAYHVNCAAPKLKVRLRWAEQLSKEKCYLLWSTGDRESCRTYSRTPHSVEPLTIDLVLPDVRHKFKLDLALGRVLDESVNSFSKYYLIITHKST